MGFIQPSSLVDEDAEAVKAKAEEEKREENEIERMTRHDQPRQIQHEVQFGDGRVFEEEIDESKMEAVPWAIAVNSSFKQCNSNLS